MRGLRAAVEVGRLQIVRNFNQISFVGVRVLITDIENTLARRGDTQLSEGVLSTFRRARGEGVQAVVLYTNNRSRDFEPMLKQIRAVGFWRVELMRPAPGLWKWPRKPYLEGFCRAVALACMIVETRQILMVGDKLRYDLRRPVLRLGWRSALVNSLGQDGHGDALVLIRPLERLTLRVNGLKRPA
jgi:predicted HAD superfamily phosphohydrolase YqeG